MFEKIKQIFTSIFYRKNKVDIIEPLIIKSEDEFLDILDDLDYGMHNDFNQKEIVESLTIDEKKTIKENIFNPLKPYEQDFNISSYMEDIYSKQNRPFNSFNYKFIFEKHICIKNFLNEEKEIYLKKIWEDAEYINKALSILNKFDINYTLDLTGGSVRDFVLNNHNKIKDLDFMVSLQTELIPIHEIQFSGFFSKEELVKVNWSSCDNNELTKSKIIQLCLNRLEKDIIVFEHSDKRKIAYAKDKYGEDLFRKDRLISVIKINGKNTHYPVDILLTDFAKPQFLNDFDFDICKASFCFVNPHVNKKFPKNYSHLISRFVARVDFWADVFNNTCTYNSQDRTINQINRSFEDHLPRILDKYSAFKVLIVGDEDKKTYANSLITKLELVKQMEKNLTKKEILIKNTIKKFKV